MPGPSLLVLAEGSIPRLPVSIDAASDRMSPNILPVTMVSKDLGFLIICMAALSTYLHTHAMISTFFPQIRDSKSAMLQMPRSSSAVL